MKNNNALANPSKVRITKYRSIYRKNETYKILICVEQSVDPHPQEIID